MNRIVPIAILLLLISGVSLRGAGQDVVQFGSIKIKSSLEPSPVVIRASGGNGLYSSGGLALTNHRWLAVQVSFIPGGINPQKTSSKNSDNPKGLHALPGRWRDDITMQMWIAFPSSNFRRSNTVYGLLEGTTRFWSIKLDGKRHTAQMFVPPQLLERYAATNPTTRKEFTMAASDYRIMVEFRDSEGSLLGRCCSANTPSKGADSFAFFSALKSSPATTVVQGAVLPRNKTPWAYCMPGTYDYIKDSKDTELSKK